MAEPTYTALTELVNDKTGATFAPGDTVNKGDFAAKVIKAWLEMDPPALVVNETEGADDGSNS